MIKKSNLLAVFTLFFLLTAQSAYIFFYNNVNKNEFTTNNVLSSSIVNVFFPMVKESYADFGYVSTAVSLWGISKSNVKKSILGDKYKYNITNIVDLNPKLKDIYYLTEGHFHGINKDLSEFSTSILKIGALNLPNYDRIWEFYFMIGMNIYLYGNDPSSARHYFYKAYKVTNNDRYLRLYEISKNKDGKVFVGLMFYRNLADNETDPKIKQGYVDKFVLYQKSWIMQKNVKVYIQKFNRVPTSLEDLSSFVNINLSDYKNELKRSNLTISFDTVNLVVILDVVPAL